MNPNWRMSDASHERSQEFLPFFVPQPCHQSLSDVAQTHCNCLQPLSEQFSVKPLAPSQLVPILLTRYEQERVGMHSGAIHSA